MADFLISYNKTAKNEGGYTNVPEDNGNWTGGKAGKGLLVGTNYGISAPVLMNYLGRIPTVDDMKNLSTEVARNIYKMNYWNIMRGDEIMNQEIADSIYDSCVNMGCVAAIKLSQKALGITETGKMNNQTLFILNNKS